MKNTYLTNSYQTKYLINMKYLLSILLFVASLFMPLLAAPIDLDIATTTQAKEGTPNINGVFTITLDVASATPLTVFYNLAGTAINPANYSLLAGTNVSGLTATQFVIAAGVTTATIQVVAVNNFTYDAISPTVIMNITPDLPNYKIGTVGTATVNITDDDNLFTVTSAGLPTENGVIGTYTFTRATSTVGAITVNFSVGGTATLTTHYTVSSADVFTYNLTAGTIVIPAAANSATLTITPINDMVINAARTVILTIASSAIPDYTISNVNNSATLSIADMPLATISVATGTNAKEGTPAINGVLNFTLTQPAPIGGLTVNYALSGTATLTTNYTLTAGTNASAVTATSFVIGAGQTSATINLIPINNFTFNATRTAILTIAANANYILGTAATTANIADDDNLFTVTSAGSPTENGAIGTYTFTRATSTVGAITVNFSVGGTANFTTHYTVSGATTYNATVGTIVIPAAANSAILTITPINDMAVNTARTVILSIVPSAIPNYTISNVNNSATLSIADFVITQIATISAGITAVEGTPTVNGSFAITLADPAPVGGLVVQYALSGTAISPANYALAAGTNVSAVTATTFTIAAGATSASLSVVPINDYLVNVARTVTITLTATPSYNIGGTGAATININDDTNTFKIIAAGSPTEDGTTGTFTITRLNTVGAVVVNFAVGGIAINPTHYTASSTNPLTFNAGSGTAVMTSGQSSVTITITPINDQIINTARTVIISLGVGTPPEYTVAAPPDNSATLTIADGAVPTISLTSAGTPTEGAGAGAFIFTRTGATTLTLFVDFDLTGTAIANTNYSVSGAVFVSGNTWRTSIIAGSTNRNVIISPINDFVANSPRTVIATTIATSPATYNIAAAPNDTRNLSILDDNNQITLFSSGSVSGGNIGTYTFTRINTVGNLFVYFSSALLSGTPTYNVTASSLFAFTAGSGGFIVIPNGLTTATLNINADISTTVGSINVTLTPAPTPNYTIGTVTAQVMNIAPAGSSFVTVTATSPISENGAGATVTFTRTGFFLFPVTVNFSVSTNGSVNYNVTGANTFAGNSGTVIIPAGISQSVAVTLAAIEDNTINGARSVDVTITSATYVFMVTTLFTVGAPNSANIIVNDSNRQISMLGGSNANESGVNSSFIFIRSGGNTLAQTIDFTLGGTATHITDYTLSGGSINITGTTGTVVIPALSNNVVVTLTPINNLALNAAKTIQITLNSGTPAIAVALAPANTATVTIDDDPNIIDISVAATPIASEVGNVNGNFVIKRLSASTLPVTISFTIGTVGNDAVFTTHYSASSPTAGASLTYNAVGGSITIPANATEVILSITPINDFVSNPNRNLQLILTNSPALPLPRTYRLSGTLANSAIMVILDDANTISIAKIGADATKSGLVIGKFRVTRTQFVGRPDVTVNFTVTGTSVLNTNYVQAGANFISGTVVIPANTASADIDITAINDWAINTTKTLNLTLTAGQYIIDATNNAALMNIVDDNNFVSVANTGNAFEAGMLGTPTATTFTFTRTNGLNTNPLLVTFSIAGAATVGTHYSLSATGGVSFNMANTQGTVTIPAGLNDIVVTLTPINDNQINTDRNVIFTVAQRSPQNYTIINTTANTSTMNIIDDKNTVSVTSSGNAFEAGATGLPITTTFTFSRTNTNAGNSLALPITFNIGGNASILTHYTLSTNVTLNGTNTQGTVIIPALSNSVVVTLTPINDNQINNNRDVILSIAPITPQSYLIAAMPTNAANVLIEDDKNIISVISAGNAFEVGAGGLPVATTFTFSRTNAIAGNSLALPVTFNIGGNAVILTHYTLSANVTLNGANTQGTIIIPALSNSIVVTLTPINDNQTNTNRDVTLTIAQTTPQSYLIDMTPNNSSTIQVIDNNNTISVVSSGVNAKEADAILLGMPNPTTYTFARTGGSSAFALPVDFAISGTATALIHYTLSVSAMGATITYTATTGTVTIPAGATSVVVTLTPINDNTINTDRIATLTITPSTTYTVISPLGFTANATIEDDKNTVIITTTGNAFEADVITGLVVPTTFTFSRTNPNSGNFLPLTVNFTIGGSAIALLRYTLTGVVSYDATQGVVTIPAGSASVVVTLTPINDNQINNDRTVVFTIAPTTPQKYLIAPSPTNSATISIIDDKNTVSIASAVTDAFESGTDGNPVATTYTFSRVGGSNALPLSVLFTIGGTATANTHYTLTAIGGVSINGTNTEGTVIIPANTNSVVVTLNPINDYTESGDRTVIFTVSPKSPETYLIGTTNIATKNIIDDTNDVEVTSAGTPSETPTTGTFTFTRSVAKTTPLTVHFTVAGTAIFPTNYTIIGAATYLAGSGTVIIPANATSVTITINPINDFVSNAPRTIILTVIHTTPAKTYVVAPAPDNQSSIAILDDVNAVTITKTGIATENGTTAKFTISKPNQTANDITVSFNINTLSPNSAIFGTNYTVTGATTFSGTSGTVLMPMNTNSVDITINPIDDNAINVDRTVTLDLINPIPVGYQLSSVATEITSTITIKNDDPQANIVLGTDAEETNAVAGKFVINFNSPIAANTTVNYIISGTANTTRYLISGGINIVGTPTSTSAVIAAGSTSAEITITPIDDFVINPAETIILTLQASTTMPLPDYFVGLTPDATMQIVDNDVVVDCAVVPITPTATWTGIQKANINYTATAGQALKFKITAMNLGTDFLRIYNGTTVNTANLIAEYTGNIIIPIDFTSISETMTVVVNSTVVSSSVTYNISCVAQEPRVNCGVATPTLYNIGSLTAPYIANSRVFRTFQSSSFANGNGQISATFTRFDVEASYDLVKVFNSNDTLNANLIGTFHNGQLPTATITSSNAGGYMTFLLYSDANVERSGFEVSMTCGVTTVIPTLSNPDLLALETLKTAYPTLATLWSSPTPITWEGVTWNQEPVQRVVSISLSDKDLSGNLPTDFAFIMANDGRMSRLQSLDLSNNKITGIVPTTFGKLKVTHLNLSNNLIDDIPTTISNIANLVVLNLSSNSLETANNLLDLENLQYLSELDLSNNAINEDLPIELFNIPNITNLNLSVNEFTGTLPEEIKDMEFIKVLNLSSNNLTGTLNFNGTVLLFDDQNLLEKLDLSKNEFTGTLPTSMGSSIKFLNLSENKLTGTIDNIANLSSLIELQLQKNEFSGALPLLLHDISLAVTINLSNNKFTGVIPNWTDFVLIRTLDLSFNKLSGRVAPTLNGIKTLTNLVLNDNELKDLPILTNLTNMKSLAVYNNRLTFEDLEPNITVPNFKPALYAPQATINDTIRTTTTIGTRIKMSTNTSGTANFYRWRKGNIALGNAAVANDSLYIINSVAIDDAGVYSCDVTSTKVVGLTLIRNPIILNVGNPRVNVSDSLALVALYRSADGKNWENSWNLSQPIRTWYGVTLSIDRVVILRLNDNKLDGKIADSLRLLTKLEELNLRKNKLGDSIPLRFGELQSLNRLDLSGNKLIGQIPTTIGNLTKLTYLDLSENSLTNAIPASFISLNKLVTLLLNDNNFNGMPTFTGIATLKRLSVENNKLTFGDLEPNKALLTTSGLRFSYSPQASINDTKTIQAVFATSLTLTTQTSGTANSYQWTKSNTNIGTNSQISDYKISSLAYSDSGAYSCKITNTVIPNLTLIRKILTVVVNQPTLLRTDSLALVDLYNSTNGAGWDKKWILTQPMDTWFGVVLDKNIGRVIRLLLSNNKLKGTISTSIGNLSKLKELNIRANPDLNGTIPSSVGNLIELEDLNFRGNKLSGTIPSSLGNLANLITLALDNNQLSGVVPKELGNLRSLSVLFLNNNKFTGILPSEINNLTLLQELYLNDNEFAKLPNLQNLNVLGTLDVKNNKLGFESLESLIRIASFQYSPQIAKDTVAVTIATGQKMDLDPQAGGTQNLYQWRTTAQTAVTTPTSSILTIQNIQPQSTGGYICSVKNNLLPNLTITYFYNVKVVPAIPQITQPLPYCVGNSSVTLTAQGTQAPSTKWNWYDGTTVIITNNKSTVTFTPKQAIDTIFAVTVVRDIESSAKAMIILYIKPILQNNNGVFTVIDNGNPKNKYQWFYFESPISGATSKTFTPEANKFGDYKVNLITEEGCAASSETYKFINMVTGTEDEMLKNSLKVYPNPTTENLKMELDNEYFGNTTIKISDVLGRVLWEQKIDKNSVFIEQNINVSSWASGTYCLRLQTNKGFATKRFVKQ